RNRLPGVNRLHTADQTVRGSHRNAANGVVSLLECNFDGQVDIFFTRRLRLIFNLYRVIDFRQVSLVELDVDNRSHHLSDASGAHLFPSLDCSDLPYTVTGLTQLQAAILTPEHWHRRQSQPVPG